MDDKRFDNLARSLGAAKSRRGFLKVLGGTAAVVAAGGATEVAANPTTTTRKYATTTKKAKCRGYGHPAVGNGNVCCSGKSGVIAGRGNVRRCL